MSLRWTMAAFIAAVVGVVGTTHVAASGTASGAQSAAAVTWTVTSKTNPMTDESNTVAVARVRSREIGTYQIEISLQGTSFGIRYSLFDAEPSRTSQPIRPLLWRFDKNPAETVAAVPDLAFRNVFHLGETNAAPFAEARSLIIQGLRGVDEYLTFDLGSSFEPMRQRLRKHLSEVNTVAAARAAEAAALNLERERRSREIRATNERAIGPFQLVLPDTTVDDLQMAFGVPIAFDDADGSLRVVYKVKGLLDESSGNPIDNDCANNFTYADCADFQTGFPLKELERKLGGRYTDLDPYRASLGNIAKTFCAPPSNLMSDDPDVNASYANACVGRLVRNELRRRLSEGTLEAGADQARRAAAAFVGGLRVQAMRKNLPAPPTALRKTPSEDELSRRQLATRQADTTTTKAADECWTPPSGDHQRLLAEKRLVLPKKTRNVEPIYPSMPLSAGIGGAVEVEATINCSGTVVTARVVKSSHPLLDDAAIAATRETVYQPALLDGKPVAIRVLVTQSFRIRR